MNQEVKLKKAESTRQFANQILKVQLLVVALYFLAIPFKNAFFTHYLLLFGTFLSMYCIASNCILNGLRADRLIAILLLVITAMISLLLSISYLRSDLLYSLVCFFFLAVMISVNDFFEIRAEFIHFVFCVALLMAVTVSVYSLMPLAYWRDNGTTAPTLTLNLGNSNYAGVLLLNILCLLWITSYGGKLRWLAYPFTAYLLYLIWRTGSRTCILGSAVFMVLSVLRSDRPISHWVAAGCMAIPVAFVPFYLWLFGKSQYWGVRILGKSLFTGREDTYTMYLSKLSRPWHWFVGNLCESGLQNAHNAPMAVLCSLGLIGAVLFFGLFFHVVWVNNAAVTHPTARAAVAALLTVCVGGCGEASMFLGGFPGVSFLFLFMWLSNYRPTSEEGASKCIPGS